MNPAYITSPLKTIRAKCLDCCGDQPEEVRLCVIPHCELFPYRFGKRPTVKEYTGRNGETLKPITPASKAIKEKCRECGGEPYKYCLKDPGYSDCPLHKHLTYMENQKKSKK